MGSKADRGSGCSRDMESTEKCSRCADAKRVTKAEVAKAISGSKNRWMETRCGVEVMEICCWKERNRAERAMATSSR
jgi:hypothetical protein